MSTVDQGTRAFVLRLMEKAEYEQAVEVFLRRYRHAQPQDFYNAFPRRARLTVVSEYLDRVAHELRWLGFPERLNDDQGRNQFTTQRSGIPDWIVLPALFLGLGTLLVPVVIKLLGILFWLRSSLKTLLFNS